MKRGYTVEEYREMLARIRATIPDAAVTSDFIVGFCGETEDDFEQTVELVRESRFKNSFIFKYSERPGTKGAELYRRRRAGRSQAAAQQRAVGDSERDQRRGQPAVHRPRRCEVLVEGPSKTSRKHGDRRAGRCNSPAARIAIGSWCSTATAGRSASCCR